MGKGHWSPSLKLRRLKGKEHGAKGKEQGARSKGHGMSRPEKHTITHIPCLIEGTEQICCTFEPINV